MSVMMRVSGTVAAAVTIQVTFTATNEGNVR